MTATKPFRRTCRQFVDGSYGQGGRAGYISHPAFAQSPQQFVRAFLLLQQDLHHLFEYIEPSDTNLQAYSYRTHELLLRACVEVEANCRAILLENGYRKPDLNMSDYKKLEATHLLSGYEVTCPLWHGAQSVRKPFAGWATGGSLPWFTNYNASKHDRHTEFERATFGSAVDAVCGALAILSAQFHTNDFAPVDFLVTESSKDVGIGGYFVVHFPSFPAADQYDFDWQALQHSPDPFAQLTFP